MAYLSDALGSKVTPPSGGFRLRGGGGMKKLLASLAGKLDAQDIHTYAGLLLLSIGCGLIYLPLAFIAPGAGLLYVALRRPR